MSQSRTRSVAFGIARRGVRILFTTPALFLPSMIFPLFFLAAFAGGLSPVGNVPGFKFPVGYTSFIYVFVVLQAATFGGIFTGFGVARDFETGFARRLLLAAPNRSGIVLGYMMVAAVRGFFSVLVVTTAAAIGGLEVKSGGLGLFGVAGLALLINQTAVLWATGVGMLLRTIQAGPIMQIPAFLSLFLAPVYVPIDLLTSWMHTIASANPITYIVEAGRNFVAGSNADAALAFGLGLGLVVVFSLWARIGLKAAEANP